MPAGRTARSGGGASWKRRRARRLGRSGSSNDGGRERQVGRGGEPLARRIGLEARPPAQLVDGGRRRPHRERPPSRAARGRRARPGSRAPRRRPRRRTRRTRAARRRAATRRSPARRPAAPRGRGRARTARRARARLASSGVGRADARPHRLEVALERVGEGDEGQARALDARLGGDRRGDEDLVAGAAEGVGEGDERAEVAGAGRGGEEDAHVLPRTPAAARRIPGVRLGGARSRRRARSARRGRASGGNSPWSITPGVADSRAASAAGSSNVAAVVGDRAAVGAERHVAQLGLAERAQRRRDPERQQLERHRRPERVDDLVARGDHHEAVGRGRDDLLARVRAAAALDDPVVGIDLVGAVDRDVEPVELLERLDREPERARGDLGGDRGGDAAQPSARARASAGSSGATVEPVPSPTRLPSSISADRRLGRGALLGVAVSHRR